MTRGADLDSSVKYSGSASSVYWEGRVVDDVGGFKRYMHEVVRHRITDSDSSFDANVRGLATTGMETQFVEHILAAVPKPEGWEVGEALAECALRDDSDRQVHWPWNTVRDRRTPRASLPGADLVGFYGEKENVVLLFGEVKTSGDENTPPSVMNGGSGMAWQLEQSATRFDIQLSLLKWLNARCQDPPYRNLYRLAVKRYLASEGRELLLFGMLMRDTPPNDRDLITRGNKLSKHFDHPTRIELVAWYLPVPIAQWPSLIQDLAP